MKGDRIARVEMLVTRAKTVFLDLGYILEEHLIEFDYGLDVRGEKNRVYISFYFKNVVL